MRTYQKLLPLTQEEQRFAEESHYVMEWFFRISGYNKDEYYDIAVFGYLKAVQNWCTREELHQYSFATIAYKAMSSRISNEHYKRNRRIRTISLNAYVADSDSFTLMDTITYDNYLNHYGVKTKIIQNMEKEHYAMHERPLMRTIL